jgi:hypothetical protein
MQLFCSQALLQALLRRVPQTIHRLSFTDRPISRNIYAHWLLFNNKIHQWLKNINRQIYFVNDYLSCSSSGADASAVADPGDKIRAFLRCKSPGATDSITFRAGMLSEFSFCGFMRG